MNRGRYKVLIADDEYWTREKLCHMIEWEKYSLELMEPAQDGEDALQKIEAEVPDILITDINMPYINGVELQKRVHEQFPEVITFVISGYDDFEYVKSSFLSGSVNYLLKPVSKIDLVDALSKALEQISEKRNRALELQKSSSLIMDREFSRLLEKQDLPFTPNITMNSQMDFAAASLMLIKLHNMRELVRTYQYDQYLLSYSVKKKLKEMAGEDSRMYIFNHVYRSNEFLIITEKDQKELAVLAQKIASYFGVTACTPVTVVLSAHTYSMESIHQAYTQTISALMTRRYRKENEVLFAGETSSMGERHIETRFGEKQAQELRVLLKKKQPAAVKEYIRLEAGLEKAEMDWSYLEVRQTVKKISSLIQDLFFDGMSAEDVVAMENLTDLADKTVEQLDGALLCEVMDETVDFVESLQSEPVADSMRGLVKRAAGYIDEHYYEELTLSTLADQFHVESSYFSRLFRQETGENVMLYIARTRIEKAKQYMTDESRSLTEIAFLTGYDDYTYFNRVFRKIMGMSPREYRSRR